MTAKYGRHSRLVEEVIAFSRSGDVLNGVGRAEDTEFAYVITDFDLALNLVDADDDRACRLVSCPDPDFDWRPIWRSFDFWLDDGPAEADAEADYDWYGQLWGDIFNNHAGRIVLDTSLTQVGRGLFNEFLENSHQADLAKRLQRVMPWRDRPQQAEHAMDIAMDAMSHLLTIAEARLHQGTTNQFYENMFEVFRRGMYPCGWRCTKPAPGKFIAYRRDD